MSLLPNSTTSCLKFLKCSSSALGNIRHLGSFCKPYQSVGTTHNLFSKSGCGVHNSYGYGSNNLVRTISLSLKCLNDVDASKKVPEVTEKEAPEKEAPERAVPLGNDFIRPNLRQKRMLVWSKKYPSVAEVPDYIHVSQMISATNIYRIKANLATIVLFLIASYITIKIGQHHRANYIVARQQEADEYHDMMDLFDAELEKAKNNEKTEKKK